MDLRKFFGKKKRSSAEASEASTAKRRREAAPLAERIYVNRSPTLILWTAVCLEVAYDLEAAAALSVASAAAGMIAGRKAASLDLEGWAPPEAEESVDVLGLSVPVVDGRGLDGQGRAVAPDRVARLLETKFDDHLDALRSEMRRVAATYAVAALRGDKGRLVFDVYATFRPDVPAGRAGWGAKGILETRRLRAAAAAAAPTTAKSEE